MARPHRSRALRHSTAELHDPARIMMDPVAMFEKSFEIADAYERWLEAQADLFLALHWFSLASLGLFRALSGRNEPAGRPAAARRRMLVAHALGPDR